MPRPKRIEKIPLEIHEFIDESGKLKVVEVWRYLSDRGGRGAHRSKLFDRLFEVALEDIAEKLFFATSPSIRSDYSRLIHGSVARLGKKVQEIGRRNGLVFGETLRGKVAKSVQLHLRALETAKTEHDRAVKGRTELKVVAGLEAYDRKWIN